MFSKERNTSDTLEQLRQLDIPYSRIFEILLSHGNLDGLLRGLENKRVIELGVGDIFRAKLNAKRFARFGARQYVGIDLRISETELNIYSEELERLKMITGIGSEIHGTDALSYMVTQSDSSAIVCSFGLFSRDILYGGNFENSKLRSYREKLCREIHRVTPENSISFHVLDHYESFINAGFEIFETGIEKSDFYVFVKK